MGQIHTFPVTDWDSPCSPNVQGAALQALEEGGVLYFPSLAFSISAREQAFLSPSILGRAKNVSYHPTTNTLRDAACKGQDIELLKAFLRRYSDAALALLRELLPLYYLALRRERTTLRPIEIQGRVTNWRQDDTRLHIDSFPSQPTQGRRLLRLFCNVNPKGRTRRWRIGETFPKVVERFWPRLAAPTNLKRHFLSWFRITTGWRSDYDHYMLQLHDAMKADLKYQRTASQEVFDFPAGSAWACFTDQVSHAVIAGQHQLEQTFTMPIEVLQAPYTAPLSVLEQFAGRPLIPGRL